MEAVRVGLVKHIAGLGPYTILVCGIFRNIRNKFLPDTLFIARHIIGVAIPVVELTHDGNFFGLRCINTEQITLFTILHERVGSHVIERATIPAGIEKLASLFRGGCCGFFFIQHLSLYSRQMKENTNIFQQFVYFDRILAEYPHFS